MPQSRTPRRPKNREVENEMIKPPTKDGKPPRPATQPAGDSSPSGEPSRRDTGER
jgi:hypothetical protein